MKKTPLYEWHLDNGANMAEFGGYKMPLWYPGGVKNEHLAAITGTGLFDTSHMAAVTISGPGAHGLLQSLFTKDLDACLGKTKGPLIPGRCVYGAFQPERGEVLDDAIVYMIEARGYMAVVNAGMGGAVSDHLAAQTGERDVDIADLTDRVGKIDLQGPLSAKTLGKVLADPGAVFTTLPYFSFKGHFDTASGLAEGVRLSDRTPILLSRTGYTGEFGFEIFSAPEHIGHVWELLLDAGTAPGTTPCGLAARDSLRGGAGLPLSHQDIGSWPFINHPWPFALPFNADQTGFTKRFLGDEALGRVKGDEVTYAFAGYDARKVSAADPAVVLDADGRMIGKVLTCVTDVAIGRHENRIYSIASPDKPEGFAPRGLCCGFIKVASRLQPGSAVALKDNRRKLEVEIVKEIRPDRTARKPVNEMV